MDLYERFLAFEVVVNVRNEEEYKKFIQRCKECRLNNIRYLERISFEDLHKNGGIPCYKIGDVCIEFQLGKGFTFSKKQEYVDWGCGVISVDEFLDATEMVS